MKIYFLLSLFLVLCELKKLKKKIKKIFIQKFDITNSYYGLNYILNQEYSTEYCPNYKAIYYKLGFVPINENKPIYYSRKKKFDTKYNTEIENNKEFLRLCINGTLMRPIPKNVNITFPFLSIYLPTYNKKDFLKRAVRSAQNQNFEDFELVFVDDGSIDDSVKEMKKLREEDPRIRIVKNDRNRGVMFTRLNGIFNTRGKYILSLDPDDMLASPDALQNIVDIIHKYNPDIVQYNCMMGTLGNIYKWKYSHDEEELRLITQPELEYISYYPKYPFLEFKKSNALIWDKAIRREVLMDVVDSLEETLILDKWNYFEDTLISFLAMKKANSYIYTNKISYFYSVNGQSLWKNTDKFKGRNILRNCMWLAQMLFKITEKTKAAKKIAFYEWRKCSDRNSVKKYIKGKLKDDYINMGMEFLKSSYLTDYERMKIMKKVEYYSNNTYNQSVI